MEFIAPYKHELAFNEDDYNAVVRASDIMDSLLNFMKEHHYDILSTSCGDVYEVSHLKSIRSSIGDLWDILEGDSIITTAD